MFRNGLKPKILLKNTLVAALAISLSGAYCLFCCQPASAASAKPAHHAKSKTDHCNFSKRKPAEISKAATGVKSFECCGLKINFFVAKLEKNRLPQQTPALTNNFSGFLESVKLENKPGFADFSYRVPLYDSRDLRIKNCVFRI